MESKIPTSSIFKDSFYTYVIRKNLKAVERFNQNLYSNVVNKKR